MMRGPNRLTRDIVVIIKSDEDGNKFLETAYGGKFQSPRELNNPRLKPEEYDISKSFWSQHALLDGEKE
jgi:hypothetical protein